MPGSRVVCRASWKPPFEGWPVGFDRLYGLELLDLTDGEVRAQVEVRDELLQPAGLVHGGVFASIAESITSIGTWKAVHEGGRTVQGMSNQTSFLRPITAGTIHADRPRRATRAARPGCGRSTSPTTRAACAPSCG